MDPEQEADLREPQKVIGSGKWDRALFTTYALSLSFFKSVLLKQGLLAKGCQDIWIIADADGYLQSLAERQTGSVGIDYKLVPVALPNGVFHPKCVYLSGPDGDLLMVGSGNVTFGGYGRNVEALEVFRPDDAPQIFWQFADFIEIEDGLFEGDVVVSAGKKHLWLIELQAINGGEACADGN